MADIRSTAAEIRRGKKEDRRKEGKKLQGKNIMAPYFIGGHNKLSLSQILNFKLKNSYRLVVCYE